MTTLSDHRLPTRQRLHRLHDSTKTCASRSPLGRRDGTMPVQLKSALLPSTSASARRGRERGSSPLRDMLCKWHMPLLAPSRRLLLCRYLHYRRCRRHHPHHHIQRDHHCSHPLSFSFPSHFLFPLLSLLCLFRFLPLFSLPRRAYLLFPSCLRFLTHSRHPLFHFPLLHPAQAGCSLLPAEHPRFPLLLPHPHLCQILPASPHLRYSSA
mmetsp:Transcript_42936/g.110866  ORF Transcript_42936/g.110866 Transcript_42936/m.110866 type:complete len:210 (-) Transcript_42936:1764-2393(-)